MSKVLAMFPGQGSQYVGMGRELLNEFPSVKVLFEEAADAARINIRKLCIDGPEDELRLTANTQPCILTVSVAIWKVLRDETGIEPAYYAVTTEVEVDTAPGITSKMFALNIPTFCASLLIIYLILT